MKLFKYIILFCILCPIIQSCADDWDLKNNSDDPGDNFTGITLMIPNVEGAAEFGATRSDEFANTRAYDTAKEANFNTLYIAAVGQDGSVQTFLKTASNGIDEGYNKYRINIKPGSYRFYIVANLNRYTYKDGNGNATFADIAKEGEKEIRDHILNFNAAYPLEPGFLPMACLNENIRVAETEGVNNATKNASKDTYVTIEQDKSKYIYADLDYLCAKVRYTILFDRENSELAGSSDIINFNRHILADYPYATNIRQQTAVNNATDGGKASSAFITEADNSTPSKWPIYLDRYHYPQDSDGKKISKSTDDSKLKEVLGSPSLMKLWTESDGEWNTVFKDERAWQGITYLPENLLTGENKKTTLNFPYTFNGSEGAYSPRSLKLFENGIKGNEEETLQRAKMYDVVVFVNSADPAQWTLNVTTSPWTLQELAYQLHGPYELIVEKSVIEYLSMEEDAVFWFRSDVIPSEIGFISPQVSITGDPNDRDSMRDLFHGGVVKNNDGSYATNENGDYLFYVRLNSNIPYRIISGLNSELGSNNGNYKKEAISFFHIVAGSLHKRIEIKDLDLNPYLKVTPQTFIIDTRELYTSGIDNNTNLQENDNFNYEFTFETNVDVTAEGVTFTLTDSENLISKGKSDGVLKITNPGNYKLQAGSTDTYILTDKTGKFKINFKDIITGSPFWNQNNEFILTFSLKTPDLEEPIEKVVIIKIRPFSGSYVIHFRDNTKNWEHAHIYVYQLLTLPSDLPPFDTTIPEEAAKNTPGALHNFAGRIVGFIERNPNSGLQWNGAAQYVFTNNLSFRGWKGYGGPDVNDPWAEATCTYTNPIDYDNSNKATMGFVMFGQPDNQGFWNYSYSYTQTYGAPQNNDKYSRYNYNVNFNGDHEANFDRWECWNCKNASPDYNEGSNERFYPGITMEQEADGWWKYTLTGVAQPGRTMIIFANWHEPWNEPQRDYRAEDYRWPGDYETGLPLFDFEDNEGWFLFDGNTTNANQKFTDDKPTGIIPHTFTGVYANKLKIGVKSTTATSISVNGTIFNTYTELNGVRYFTNTNFSPSGEHITVTVSNKSYNLYPKNFKLKDGMYETAQPLFLAFDKDIKLFVKWSDAFKLDQGWGGDYAYYQPPVGGSDWISVISGSNSGTIVKTEKRVPKEYGNYKNATIKFDNTGTYDTISLRLCTNANGSGNYYKLLKVQDLPQYYNPSEGYYQINWHLLPKP